jgi:heme O synthase-like polyprenyltransferase
MADRSLTNILMLLLIAAAAVAGGVYYYNHYIEPQNDGPMERAGEKIDNALDGK